MALTLSGSSPSLQSYQGGALTSGTAQNTTSGTVITFTGIPSWVKRVTVIYNGISTNGSSRVGVQLGSGSLTTTGYLSYYNNIYGTNLTQVGSDTTLFGTASAGASSVRYGSMVFTLVSGNIWVCNGFISENNPGGSAVAGSVTLSGALDRIGITTINGTDTFDAGSINILYE